ncbi:MAG: ThuA domain-containing protein [Saprospiraceae bacterium]
MNKLILSINLLFLLMLGSCSQPIKVLIIDGQNNHEVWPKSTIMMKQYLEETGQFKVAINRTRFTWKAEKEKAYLSLAGVPATENLAAPKSDQEFRPAFKKYDVVVSNFGWNAAAWSIETQKEFEQYIANGGGFVSIHAADNSFPDWKAYNEMIGLGGWGGRSEKDGPYVYYSNEGALVRDTTIGKAGKHGARHEFPITVRIKDHPITKGMPYEWLTTEDECYAMLRGPAENMTVLATGKDISKKAPTNRHEPVLMVIDYGKGRIFHSTLGHSTTSTEGVGFITSFLRGVEWAATGKVTQKIPADFPTSNKATSRKFEIRE